MTTLTLSYSIFDMQHILMRPPILLIFIVCALNVQAQETLPQHPAKAKFPFLFTGSVFTQCIIPFTTKNTYRGYDNHLPAAPNIRIHDSYRLGGGIRMLTPGDVGVGPVIDMGMQFTAADNIKSDATVTAYHGRHLYIAPGISVLLRKKRWSGMLNMQYAYGLTKDKIFHRPDGFMPSIGLGYRRWLLTCTGHLSEHRLFLYSNAMNSKLKTISLGLTFLI